MNFLGIFGIGCRQTAKQGIRTEGVVTEVYTCWWFRVNTQAVRVGGGNTARYPHIITFTYTVDGTAYTGKRFVSHVYSRPQEGQRITVYYEAAKPEKYAVKL
ncbi:MAG: DUF3592 domain-containing protein [Ruminococcaceae bacterium]|nr:DUF3592 domain-containing protein [Oscillospiraceae bacterium]